jgi:sporulation protein YlmC with PRC-barrel domain
MKVHALKGLAVVSIASGAKLGYVDDVRFDPQEMRVAALEVKADNQRGLVPLSDVKSIGKDAVMVPSDEVLRNVNAAGPLSDLPGLDQIRRLKVVDEAGTYLGRVQDLEIDLQDGQIVSVAAHEGGVLGVGGKTTTAGRNEIRSIGDEVMVIATQTDEG